MRICAVFVLVGALGCSGCSGGETPPSPDGDPASSSVRDGGIWSPARSVGIEVLEHGRALPPNHVATLDELRPDAGAGAFADMRVRVDAPGQVRTVPCAVPSGSYCDGFAVVDDRGRMLAVDTYAYLGPKPTCRSRWAEGARVGTLRGIWQQRSTTPSPLSVVALASCDDLDGPEPPAGVPAPASDEVHQLVTGWAPALTVSVRGIVVARSGAFGFALQDPDGAPASGIRVVRSRTSQFPASPPEIGDRVIVTARTSRSGERVLEL